MSEPICRAGLFSEVSGDIEDPWKRNLKRKEGEVYCKENNIREARAAATQVCSENFGSQYAPSSLNALSNSLEKGGGGKGADFKAQFKWWSRFQCVVRERAEDPWKKK